MSIILDSANLDDAVRAAQLGFIRGITTNPSLMRRETDDPLGQLGRLLKSVDLSEIFYQPTGAYGAMESEAAKAWSLDEARVVLKLPATPAGVVVAAEMVRRGAKVSLTAVQSPHAMIVAESVGCVAVIPYLDRSLRDLGTDQHLIASMARVRRGSTRIVAASVKSVGQFLWAFHEGADAVTAPLSVLEELLTHPASTAAERQFAEEYRAVDEGRA